MAMHLIANNRRSLHGLKTLEVSVTLHTVLHTLLHGDARVVMPDTGHAVWIHQQKHL